MKHNINNNNSNYSNMQNTQQKKEIEDLKRRITDQITVNERLKSELNESLRVTQQSNNNNNNNKNNNNNNNNNNDDMEYQQLLNENKLLNLNFFEEIENMKYAYAETLKQLKMFENEEFLKKKIRRNVIKTKPFW